MADSEQRCDYLADGRTQKTRCERMATHRSPTDARCALHGGHLDYTERWNGTAWQPMSIDPISTLTGVTQHE